MSRVKTRHLVTILLLTFAIAQAKVSIATQEATVKVYPYQNVAAPGQQFTISIVVENVTNLFAIEVKLYWNQSILQLTNTSVMLGVESHPGGVLHGQVYQNETIESGKYILYGTSIGKETPSFNGSGTVAELIFNATRLGNCQLTLQTELYDKPGEGEASQPIQHITENGYVSIEPKSGIWQFTYIATAIIIIAAAILLAFYAKRRKAKSR
ncbi:MAG: cohesin domain-containing protein [Candidatus Bathyarchaeia archaeon]